jgi:ribosomal protein L20A (L18A)
VTPIGAKSPHNFETRMMAIAEKPAVKNTYSLIHSKLKAKM